MNEEERLRKELEQTCVNFKRTRREIYQNFIDFLLNINSNLEKIQDPYLVSTIDNIKIKIGELREDISYC